MIDYRKTQHKRQFAENAWYLPVQVRDGPSATGGGGAIATGLSNARRQEAIILEGPTGMRPSPRHAMVCCDQA